MSKEYDVFEEISFDPVLGPIVKLFKLCGFLFKTHILGVDEKSKLLEVTVKDLNKKIQLPKRILDEPKAFAYSYNRKGLITFNGINPDLHSIITGTTGSGKSILSERIIYESLNLDKTVIFIDPKGSIDTKYRLKEMANKFGRKFYSVTNFGDKNEISLKLFENASVDQVKNAIMKTLDWSEQYYKHASNDGIERALSEIYSNGLNLKALVESLLGLRDDKVAGAILQLKDICNSDLYQIISGDNKKSIAELRDENAVVYIGLSSLGYPEVTKSIGKLLIYNFAYHASRVEGKEITVKNDVQVIFDEFVSIGTKDIVHLANKTRSAGLTLALAIQCISDLDSIDPNLKGQLFGNANNFFIGHCHVPSDVEFICGLFGTHTTSKLTVQVEDELSTGKGSVREVQAFKVHPEIIKNLNPGQFLIGSKIPHRYWDIVHVIFRDYTKMKPTTVSVEINTPESKDKLDVSLFDTIRRNK